MMLSILALIIIDIYEWDPDSADNPVPQALPPATAAQVLLIPLYFAWFVGVCVIRSGGEFRQVLRNPPLVVKMWHNILT